MKLAILGSTKGTDAQFILNSISSGKLKQMSVKCIISNRSKAEILDKAKKFNIPGIFTSARKNPKKTKKPSDNDLMSRQQYDAKITTILEHYDIDYILLVGWMRILSKQFVERWKNRILNIHPSLLPAYEGGMDMNIHKAVLQRGCKITGATLMFVDDGADTGPIIDQIHVRVLDNDTPQLLKERVQKAEQNLFMSYLPLLRDGKLKIENNKVKVEQ